MFNNPKNLEELRNQYKELVFKYHPDVSGYDSTEIMKSVNNQYELLTKELSKDSRFIDSELEFAGLFREKLEVLIKLQGLTIEIIGNWLWITGNTREHKETLKELKFNYAPKKKAWFFKTYRYFKTSSEKSLDEIRDMYGSQVVSNSQKSNEKNILQLA